MKHIKKALLIFTVFTIASSTGLVAGSLVDTAVLNDNNIVYAGCEEDECEGNTVCDDNSGYSTSCNMRPGKTCITDSCGW